MRRKIFKKYAKYYDVIYKNKNYLKETNYIHKLLEGNKSSKKILEIGCGSGMHSKHLSNLDYIITGIDISSEMVKLAKKNVSDSKNTKFLKKDVLKIKYKEKFDAAISLFHALCYLTNLKDIKKAFINVNNSLKKGGLFIFDFWFTPAVKFLKIRKNEKKYNYNNGIIVRKIKPSKLTEKNSKIKIDILIYNKKKQLKEKFVENHFIRHFDYIELKKILNSCGFKFVVCYEWLKHNKPNKNSWSAVMIAKKNER